MDRCAVQSFFDFQERMWYALPPMRVPRKGCAGITFKNKVYIAGGHNDNSKNQSRNAKHAARTVECYDPTLNKWTLLPLMNQVHYRPTLGILNDSIVVFGNNLEFASYEYFDFKQNKWIFKIIKDPKKLRAACFMKI